MLTAKRARELTHAAAQTDHARVLQQVQDQIARAASHGQSCLWFEGFLRPTVMEKLRAAGYSVEQRADALILITW